MTPMPLRLWLIDLVTSLLGCVFRPGAGWSWLGCVWPGTVLL